MKLINKKTALVLAGICAANVTFASVTFKGDVRVEVDAFDAATYKTADGQDLQDGGNATLKKNKADIDLNYGFHLYGTGKLTEGTEATVGLGIGDSGAQSFFSAPVSKMGSDAVNGDKVWLDTASIHHKMGENLSVNVGKINQRVGFKDAVVDDTFRPNGAQLNFTHTTGEAGKKKPVFDVKAAVWLLQDDDHDTTGKREHFNALALRASGAMQVGEITSGDKKTPRHVNVGVGLMSIDNKDDVTIRSAAQGNNEKKYLPVVVDVSTNITDKIDLHGSYIKNTDADKKGQGFIVGAGMQVNDNLKINGEYRKLEKNALWDDLSDRHFGSYKSNNGAFSSGTDVQGVVVNGAYKVNEGLSAGVDLYLTQPATKSNITGTDTDDTKYMIKTYAVHTF